MPLFCLYLLTFLCLALAPGAAYSSVANVPRFNGEIIVDGVLSAGEWSDAVRLELHLETDPAENGPAPVETTAFLIEDGENLYVAFEANDPNPEVIRAYLRDRDSAWSDDHVGIVLDTYNDERRAFEFYANPLGVQMDKTRDDTAGGPSWNIDDSWDAIWESAGHINDTGYVVEMRIPLSQLRFPDVDGKKTWGYDLVRMYPRDRTHTISNHSQDRNRSCYLCQVGKLEGLEGSRPGRDLEIVPTITASKNDSTEDPGLDPIQSGDPEVEGGLTVRWGVTPDLTANIAINPDFSQVESDVAQLDVNNRFALSYPEKRPFFLEGADYFTTPINAVFTRTVGSPDFGGKLTGKKGENTFGVFAAQDAETNLLFPELYGSDTETLEQSNTAFVGRYSRGFADTSSVGALVTTRDGDNYHNYVGGFDARWKINDQHRLEFQHLQSETAYPEATAIEYEQPLRTFSGHASYIEYEYDSRDWFGSVEYEDLSSGFRADSGFVGRVGGSRTVAKIGRVLYDNGDSWWDRIRTSLHVKWAEDEEGELAEHEFTYRFGIGGPMQSWFQVALVDAREREEGILYDMKQLRAYVDMQPTSGLQFSIITILGDQIDYSNDRLGKKWSIQPNIAWNLSRNLLLRVRSVYTELETQEGEPIFDAMLADTRLTWQFNLRSFLRLTVQYQDVERNTDLYIDEEEAHEKEVGRQLLYSYKLNPQTVFFLGYSDNYINDDSLDKLTVSDRNWFMKIGYAWAP